MGRRRQEWIIRGPYEEMHRAKRRYRVVERDPFGEETRSFFSSETAAKCYVRERKKSILGEKTVAEILVLWRASMADRRLGPNTIKNNLSRVGYLLGPDRLELPIGEITPGVAKACYDGYRTKPGIAVETAKGALRGSKTFFKWASENGHCRVNPFAGVAPVGKGKRGKRQMRVDEARAFLDAALGENSLPGVACAVGLMLGLRPGEIVGLRARDVDDGGRLLWIDGTKTEGSRRTLAIPEPLQMRLVEITRGLAGEALIFPYSRPWVNWNTHRICRIAGVTNVCAHSLRGLKATMAMVQGLPAMLVSKELGHESVQMTRDHYWDLSAVEQAQLDRFAALLVSRRGGSGGTIEGISIPRGAGDSVTSDNPRAIPPPN